MILYSNEKTVREAFKNAKYNWDDKMKGMLGKEFTILKVRDGAVALPAPNGAMNGKWFFPPSVVSPSSRALEETDIR